MNNKIFFVLIASVLLVGYFYLGGFNFGTTGNVISEFADSSEELIVVPVKVHVVREPSLYYTSARDRENIIITIDQANRIWGPARIYFKIDEIVISDLESDSIPNPINGNSIGLFDAENFDQKKINVFFTKSLNGINGLALTNINSVLVADFTTVNDFRTTAHEFGHLLGLKHVPESNKLMARGKNGEGFDAWEVEIARTRALKIGKLS